MALTFDWPGRVVSSDASILDLPAFHAALRDAEDDEAGAIHPVIHTWKSLDLGGGATFGQVDFINGWTLRFPVPGNYEIRGNLNATIVPTSGVYVERKTSAAYVTTAVGSTGPTVADIAAEVIARLMATVIPANAVQIKGQAINGAGTEADPWGP